MSEQQRRPRVPRRVTTPPVPGSDPTPQAARPVLSSEDDERRWGDATGPNDDRLKADKPPHY